MGFSTRRNAVRFQVPLPVGLVYAEDDSVILGPDAQIQQAIHLLFATFKRDISRPGGP